MFEITNGIIKNKAKKVIVYGPEGIGKSTFISNFPDVLYIDTEGSTGELDVKRAPKPTSWQMLINEIQWVIKDKPCKTVAIDTADWAESLCTESVCAKHGKSGVEDFGYGNGYTYVAEEWGRFLNLLQDVIDVANINVVLAAHTTVRKFDQPNEMGSYDRYELKLGKKTTAQTAPLTKEWADMVLFANYKTFSVAVDDKSKKHKAQGGQRVMYTTHHPCWDAKNRYGLQEELAFNYGEIAHIFKNEDVSLVVTQASPSIAPPTNPLDIADGTDSGPTVYTVDQSQPPLASGYDGIQSNLADLMKQGDVREEQLRKVVGSKGYFPESMPVKDYPKDFVNDVLVAAWGQVYQMIIEDKIPF